MTPIADPDGVLDASDKDAVNAFVEELFEYTPEDLDRLLHETDASVEEHWDWGGPPLGFAWTRALGADDNSHWHLYASGQMPGRDPRVILQDNDKFPAEASVYVVTLVTDLRSPSYEEGAALAAKLREAGTTTDLRPGSSLPENVTPPELTTEVRIVTAVDVRNGHQRTLIRFRDGHEPARVGTPDSWLDIDTLLLLNS
jgi:hypothetical protein